MTPVMLIIPELQELHGKSAPPLSMVHLEVDSLCLALFSWGGYSLSHGVGMDEYFALWISNGYSSS
jgi:hypothetical protein